MVPGTGAVPVVHGLFPSELAVGPGVMVTEQLAPAAKTAPQVVLKVVPMGKASGSKTRFSAWALPVFVTVITLGNPDVGVPLIPYSVNPETLSARSDTLNERVVGSATQFTATFVTLPAATVPDPSVIEHTCPAG